MRGRARDERDGAARGSMRGRLSVLASSAQEESCLLRLSAWKKRKYLWSQGMGQCPSCWDHQPCWALAPPEKQEASLDGPDKSRANSPNAILQNVPVMVQITSLLSS